MRTCSKVRWTASASFATAATPEDDDLVVVLGVDLGDGHVEGVPQPVEDAADHLPLVLQALRLPQQQPHPQGADDHGLERPLHLLDAVRLDHVVDLDVVVAGDLDAALEALADLADVVLEALERLQAGASGPPAGRSPRRRG